MTVQRKDVPKSDRWNVEALYPSSKAWETEFKKVSPRKEAPFFPEIAKFKGKLAKGAKEISKLLDTYYEIERKLRKLYTYARLRHDEDIADDKNKKANDTISTIYHLFSQESSWIEPELLAIEKTKLKKYCQDKGLKKYSFYLECLMRLKPHTLDAEKEYLIALANQALETPHKTFSAISDADFKFGKVEDSKGIQKELTHATYGLYLRDHDRTLRKNAFCQLLGKYGEYENSITELLHGEMQKQYFHAKAKNYPSCLDAALFGKNIDTSVYRSLIKAVHANISSLHKYMKLRKKALKLKELHLYDTYVPMVDSYDRKFTYEEAEDLVIQSVAPLGREYQNILKNGLKDDRWVDRFENKNKRSGAYSSGCFDSSPYILMNFKGILRDVFTLAHEAGHSMHSYFSRTHQPYHYSDYTIFVAEVASTFNEELLMHKLLDSAKTKKERAFLINEKLEDLRATLFRQTMFAEFELFLHEAVEKRIPLTAETLKEEYLKLNQMYFGKEVTIDPEIAFEWARIPHFYYGFYVYQYATGISAALALAEKVLHGREKERQAYLSFLKTGSSDYPLNELRGAGVDMTTTKPVERAIAKFSSLTDELEELIT